MSKATHRILRTFPTAQVIFPGQFVDATDWINTRVLENTGYIERLEPEEIEVSETVDAEISNSETIENESAQIVETTTEAPASITEEIVSDVVIAAPTIEPTETPAPKKRSRKKKSEIAE